MVYRDTPLAAIPTPTKKDKISLFFLICQRLRLSTNYMGYVPIGQFCVKKQNGLVNVKISTADMSCMTALLMLL